MTAYKVTQFIELSHRDKKQIAIDYLADEYHFDIDVLKLNEYYIKDGKAIERYENHYEEQKERMICDKKGVSEAFAMLKILNNID